MGTRKTLDRCAGTAKGHTVIGWSILAGTVGLLSAFASSARAADGCQVLLCLAAPSWRSVSQCVPPVTAVMRDLALGRSFPVCTMSGPANTASHQWSSAPAYCPEQYTRVVDGVDRPIYTCDYAGAVSVTIEGVLWSRTWWGHAGDTVTEFTPAAKSQLGTWDTRFDDDHAAWLGSVLTVPPADQP